MQDRSDLLRERGTFAAAVADALTAKTGDQWTVTQAPDSDTPSGARLSGGDRRLHLYFNSSDRKVQVTGQYADEGPGRSRVYLYHAVNGFERSARPSIGVGIDRPADRVAADIVRRLIPDYDAVRAAIVERVKTANEADAAKVKAVASMADALGVDRPAKRREHDPEPEGVYSPVSAPCGYGDFKTSYDGTSWTIELRSVPTAVAERIARLMRDARQD